MEQHKQVQAVLKKHGHLVTDSEALEIYREMPYVTQLNNMVWTNKLPTQTGWYWFRHVVGSIPTDTPLHCVICRKAVKLSVQAALAAKARGETDIVVLAKGQWWSYKRDKEPSVYVPWDNLGKGGWRKVSQMPKGYRYSWSSRPIPKPTGCCSAGCY